MPQPKWVTELLPEEQTELTAWLNEEKENAKKTVTPPPDGGTPPPPPATPGDKPLTAKDVENLLDSRDKKRESQSLNQAIKAEQEDFVTSVKKDKAIIKEKFGVDIDEKELTDPQSLQYINANYRVAKLKNPNLKMTPGEFYVRFNNLLNENFDDKPPVTEEHRHGSEGSGVSDYDKQVPPDMKKQLDEDIKEFVPQWTEEAKAKNEKVSDFIATKTKEYKDKFLQSYKKIGM